MKKIVTYNARMKFKYNEKTYEKGDEWIPAGSKYDETIIGNGRYVIRHERTITRNKTVKKAVSA